MKHERFGRYLILDHLVDGGMAKISRALYLGEQADKVVVIKTMKPQFSEDESFKTMFMDEVKVTFKLVHPNITQTYDYGFINNQLYVVMEYCDGKNLKEFMNKLHLQDSIFRIDLAVYVIAQACLGLYYAHNFSDKMTGKNANIIHRDISPQNIMLTYDGGIKIIDFGIAKAESNSEATKTGTIKGKFSYLAPEYLEGKKLDPRYDEFALAITLWEMLCGKKLFSHKNDIEVLKKIQECYVPAPSTVNSKIPKALDDILLKALSKDRENRYADLYEFHMVLMKFLNATYPDFHPKELVDLAHNIFKDEIKEDREKFKEFGKIDPRPYLDEIKKEQQGSNEPQKEKLAPLEIEGGVSLFREIEFKFEQENTIKKNFESTRTGIKKNQLKKNEATRHNITAVYKPEKSSDKNILIIGLILLVVGSGSYIFYKKNNYKISNQNDNSNKMSKQSDSQNDSIPEKSILLNNFDVKRMQAFVEGKSSQASPIGEIKAPAGKEVVIRVQTEGRSHYILPIKIDPNKPVEIEVPEMPAAAFGYLVTNGSCPKGILKYEIYGEKRESKIPLPENAAGIGFPLKADLEDNWAPVVYEVVFQSDDQAINKTIEVHIDKEDQNVDLCALINQNVQKTKVKF